MQNWSGGNNILGLLKPFGESAFKFGIVMAKGWIS